MFKIVFSAVQKMIERLVSKCRLQIRCYYLSGVSYHQSTFIRHPNTSRNTLHNTIIIIIIIIIIKALSSDTLTHPETLCTNTIIIIIIIIITRRRRGSGLTVAFVERYQSGMGTWWFWNLRGTHFRASASHRSELRSGKLWWMSRPSWLHRPRDQPLSSEPWETRNQTRHALTASETETEMTLTRADTNNGCFYSSLH